MAIFILSREGEEGRVILDDQVHGAVLGSFSADPITRKVMQAGTEVEVIVKSAWRGAREKVDESKFYHFEGEGWFPVKRKEAA